MLGRTIRRLLTIEGLTSLGQQVWAVLSSGAVGVAMTWAAAATDALNAYGPVAWGAIGLASFILMMGTIAGFSAVRAWAKAQLALANARSQLTERVRGVNPLSEIFHRERISVAEFAYASSVGLAIGNRSFFECDIVGPGAVYIEGGAVQICSFIDCNYIETYPPSTFKPDLTFANCVFCNCRFIRVTIFVRPEYKAAGNGGTAAEERNEKLLDSIPTPHTPAP